MPDHGDEWVCELCHEHILPEQPHLRITADAVVSNANGDYDSLCNNEVMVFSVFHSACLRDTMNDDSLGDVPYIWEARSIYSSLPMCNECERVPVIPVAKKQRPSYLKVMQGGLR